MYKDFDTWHPKKKSFHQKESRVYFHEREVWWCSLGANIGFEQDGKGEHFARPVVIFKKFNNKVCWAIPLTTKMKKGGFYFPVNLDDDISRTAILSQLRLVDAKRLYQKIGGIHKEEYKQLSTALIALCA